MLKKIALPPTAAAITLEDLKFEDGEPVVIVCAKVDAELIAAALGVLPGGGPETGAVPDAVAMIRVAKQAREVIAGAVFLEEDGAREPLLDHVPFEALTVRDVTAAFATVCMVSGVGTKAAEGARFRYEYGSGLADGGGAGRDGASLREDAVRADA